MLNIHNIIKYMPMHIINSLNIFVIKLYIMKGTREVIQSAQTCDKC